MPPENVKEIILLEITEKFKTKSQSVTPLAQLSLAHRAPLPCLVTASLPLHPLPLRLPLLRPPEEEEPKNSPAFY